MGDSGIAAICGTRVYPYDIRTAGPDAHTEVTTPEGYHLPTICVDDQGAFRNPLAPMGTTDGAIAIWMIAERSLNGVSGSDILDTLAARITAVLHCWQDEPTKAYLTYSGRLGQQYDPFPDTGMIDRVDFKSAAVLIGVRT